MFQGYHGSTLDIVIDFTHNEMVKNIASEEALEIKHLLKGYNPFNFFRACILWKNLVTHGARWDFKKKIKFNITNSNWIYDRELGIYYNFDIWSNIHYGFLGKYVGFNEWILLSFAGLAQFTIGTTPKGYWKRRSKLPGKFFLAALDSTSDQNAIRLGFQLLDDYGTKLTKKNFLETIQKSYTSIYTKSKNE